MDLAELMKDEKPRSRTKAWYDLIPPETLEKCEQIRADYKAPENEDMRRKFSKRHIAEIMVKKFNLPVKAGQVREWL